MTRRRPAHAAAAVLAGCCGAARRGAALASDAASYVDVSVVPLRCPIAIEATPSFRMPSGWTITPQHAVELATARLVKCNSKFSQGVAADGERYDVYEPAFGPTGPPQMAVVVEVNGVTGKVSERRTGNP